MKRAGVARAVASAVVGLLATASLIQASSPDSLPAFGRAQRKNRPVSSVAAVAPLTTAAIGAAGGSSEKSTVSVPASMPTTAVPTMPTSRRKKMRQADPQANREVLIPAEVPGSNFSVPLVAHDRMIIAKLGLDRPVFEGIAQNVIDAGVAHWPGTATPGGIGNVVIAGHRSTYSRPFHDIAKLAAGDTIVFETETHWRYTYTVERQFVVSQNALWISDQTAGRHVTIFTCHPIGSSRQRLVTVGVLTKTQRLR